MELAAGVVGGSGREWRHSAPMYLVSGPTIALLAVTLAIESRVEGGIGELLDGFTLSGLLLSVAFLALGSILGPRQHTQTIAWVALAIGFTQALSLASAAYGFEGLQRDWPAAHWSVWASQWTWVPGYVAAPTVLLLLFPDGKLPGKKWWPALAVGVAAIATSSLGWALLPYEKQDSPLEEAITNPLSSGVGEHLMGTGAVLGLVAAALSLIALTVRFVGSAGKRRQQIKWVFIAGIATGALLGLAIALGPDVGPPVRALATPLVPAAMGIAIVRHRLWDIDIIINKALVYGLLSLSLFGIYVLTVAGLGGMLGEHIGAPLIAVALTAVAVEPLRKRLQRLANRFLYGHRNDPYIVISALSQRLEALDPQASVISDAPLAIARALRMPYVAIETAGGLRAGSGEETERSRAFPLTYRGEPMGTLVVGLAEGEDLSRSQQELLDDLSRHIGVALHAEALTHQLQRAREDLVAAREEEHRRLRRDLHDDLGPSLSAAALQMESARALLGTDPRAAFASLEKVAGQIRDTVKSVRSIVEDLGPPSLDELGLAGAIRQRISRLSVGGPRFDLEMPHDLGALPAAVEVAAYRILSEAVTNVLKHANASCCRVGVRREGGLLITVADDGRSIDGHEVRAGVGLRSMMERAFELGGTLTLGRSDLGGTEVRAWLPVREG